MKAAKIEVITNGEMIMMTVDDSSVTPGSRLLLEKVTHKDKLNEDNVRVHYDLIEVLLN